MGPLQASPIRARINSSVEMHLFNKGKPGNTAALTGNDESDAFTFSLSIKMSENSIASSAYLIWEWVITYVEISQETL